MRVLYVVIMFLLALLSMMLSGCSATRTEATSIERTRGMQAGQPTDLTTIRQERADSKTDISVELGPMVQAAVSAAMGDVRGVVNGLAGQMQTIAAKPAPPTAQEVATMVALASDGAGLDPSTGAALGGAGGLALLALREFMAHRKTTKDADEAWDEIKQRAKPTTT